VCIKDVCADCNSQLGSTADVDVLKDERLVSAVLTLGLDDLRERLLELGTTAFEDIDTRQRMPGSTKGGKLRLTPQCEGPVWSVSEDDVEKILGGSLTKHPPESTTSDQAIQWLREMIADYEKIEPGQSVWDDRLGRGLRKARAEISHEFKTEKGAGKRLAAKVAYEVLHCFLPWDRIVAMKSDFDRLAEFAKTGTGDMSHMIFYPTPDDYRTAPVCRHVIKVSNVRYGVVVDVILFGTVSYRVWVKQPPPPLGGPLIFGGEALDMVGMMMSFEPGSARNKYLAKQIHGDTQVFVAEAPSL
jgi:hypothetical protein